MRDLKNKNKNYLILGILLTLIILIGSTYAFFSYFKSAEAFTITSNSITASFASGSNYIDFSNAYPISDEYALANLNNLTYIDFSVSGNESNEEEAIKYEIFLTEKSGNTLSSDYIKVYLTDQNNIPKINPTIYSSLSLTTYPNEPTGKVVTSEVVAGQFTKNYRLYCWLDSSYEQNTTSQTFSFYVNLFAYNDLKANETSPDKMVLRAADAKEIATPACANKTRDTSDNDGITYISGTSDCIDFNYVWYSGKLWRITAIYPNGTMKMITDNNITSIAFNESTPYYYTDASNTSWMYQWLNEDFLDTLYNYENIIVHDSNTYWNATMPSSTEMGTKPAEKDSQTGEYLSTMIPTNISPVGLLNSYEYYKAYQNASPSTNYLNIGYYWWFLEPYYDATTPSNNRYVNRYGNASNYSHTEALGARPSVILQSGLTFTGSGSKTDPYKIVGDMSSPILGTTKVNERVFERNNETYSYNGEYVKIKYNNELSPLYRIVGIEKDPSDNSKMITKLVAMDYADNSATKKFATDNSSGSGTTYGSGYTIDNANNPPTTWYSYFHGTDTIVDGNPVHNNGWFDNLSYKSLLTRGTYYMGNGDSASKYNYKGAICASPSASVITRSCTKTANTNTFNVGLLRYGEIFATQQKTSTYTYGINMWLITKYSSSSVRSVNYYGYAGYSSTTIAHAARPSIHLISNAKFLTCSTSKCDGTEAYPYEVGL